MNEVAPNLIRTYVPVLIGGLASWLTARGIGVTPATQAGLIVTMTSILTAAYYTVARVVEQRCPKLGAILLGCRPATSLGRGEDWPEAPDDEAEWPPREEVPAVPTGVHLVQPAQAAPQQGSLAEFVASTPAVPPGRRRGPVTGQLPRLQRPAGR